MTVHADPSPAEGYRVSRTYRGDEPVVGACPPGLTAAQLLA